MRFLCMLFMGAFALAGCGETGSPAASPPQKDSLPAAVRVAMPPPPAGGSVTPTPIAQDFTGIYVDDRSRNTEAEPFEGILQICPSGIASYVLHSNQLIYTFHVQQVDLGGHHARLDFYFESGDHGRGFMDADLAEPPAGTLVATAELTAEYELSFDWKDPAFTAAVRRASPKDPQLHPFPKAFYYATYMPNPMQGCETE